MRDELSPAAMRVVRRVSGAGAEVVRLDVAAIPHRAIRETTAGLRRVALDVRPSTVARSFVSSA